MAYEPTNWKTGDVVTSAKLNKLENGVAAGSGVLVVTVNGSGPYTLDKTAGEIFAECQAKKLVVVYSSQAENAGTFAMIVEYDVDESGYYTFKTRGDGSAYFYANSADDYPATQS